MEKPDLAQELREYRERNGLTEKQMAELFNLPVNDYTAFEIRSAVPSPEMEQVLRNVLAQQKLGPPKPVKWYRSRTLHWPAPIVFGLLLIWAVSSSEGFHEAYGKERIHTKPPLKSYTYFMVLICGVYWAIFRPPLPFSKKED